MGAATYIYAVREAYRGNEITLSPSTLGGASQIQGVVISDAAAGNTEPGLFFIQQTVASANQVGDITRGIALRMSSGNVTWKTGDSLRINVEGMKLDRINGRLTISGVTEDRVTKLAENRTPLVRSANLAMLNVMMPEYESSLVAVHADEPGRAGLQPVEQLGAHPVTGVDDDVGGVDRLPDRGRHDAAAARDMGVAQDEQRRGQCTPSRSTTKISVSPPLMTPPAPASP